MYMVDTSVWIDYLRKKIHRQFSVLKLYWRKIRPLELLV